MSTVYYPAKYLKRRLTFSVPRVARPISSRQLTAYLVEFYPNFKPTANVKSLDFCSVLDDCATAAMYEILKPPATLVTTSVKKKN